MPTIDQIHALANERHELWKTAGKRFLTAFELIRIDEITASLAELWEQRRKELAGGSQ
jgi:hypothetical protein